MNHRAYYIVGLWVCLNWIAGLPVRATPCLRLGGVVRDHASHQPLTAQFYLKTPTGRTKLGSSTNAGLFELTIACPAIALIIEKPGYRPQQLALNTSFLTTRNEPIWLIIPLVAVDEEGSDRPYMQTEQTYFVQANTGGKVATQAVHTVFIISDALAGKALPAQACFVFTKTGQKRCLMADAEGKLSIDFTETDIVAFEVTMPGYQTYEGNFRNDRVDGGQLQHTIKMTRELTVLSIQPGPGAEGYELRPLGSSGHSIVPEPIPGQPAVVAACDLLPQRYQLIIFDQQHTVREQRTITLRSGLNIADARAAEIPAPAAVTPAIAKPVAVTPIANRQTAEAFVVAGPVVAPLDRLDSLPMLYFEQSNFKLKPASEITLLQVAAYLKQHPTVRLQLTGHTDPEGDERLNRTLAEQRAQVVSRFLYWRGVTDNRMEIRSAGSRFPIAPSDTEENKAKNRRVAMKLIAQTP